MRGHGGTEGPRRVTAVVLLVAGLLVLAVGVGLGPRHLALAGPTVTAVAGLAVLLLGIVLTAAAVIRLLRGVRARWWPLVLPLVLVAAFLAVWTVGQGVAASFPPSPPLGERTLDVDHEDATVTTVDGVRLDGWYVPARNGAAVVLRHGSGNTRAAVVEHAEVLAAHGYGVLMLDARGHGESEGRGMDLGWYGERDTRAAVDYLLSRPEVDADRLGLVGLSMGGEEVIGAAGVDDRVRAVVAEGATARVSEDKGYLAAYGWRGDLQRRIDALTSAVTQLLTPAPRPGSLSESVASATSREDPVVFLLIVADDEADEELAADHLLARPPGGIWVARGGHTRGRSEQPEEWESRVVGFLDDALGPQ